MEMKVRVSILVLIESSLIRYGIFTDNKRKLFVSILVLMESSLIPTWVLTWRHTRLSFNPCSDGIIFNTKKSIKRLLLISEVSILVLMESSLIPRSSVESEKSEVSFQSLF